MSKFFDTPAGDVAGVADAKNRPNRQLLWFLGRMERLIGENGFAVGSKISLADVMFYNLLGETLLESGAPEGKRH